MIRQLVLAASAAISLSACSGSIYRQNVIDEHRPVAIALDARQRLALSQVAPGPRKDDPHFRRFCAEPAPDAFTVLGVSASAGGNLGLDNSSKNVSAALQAAFSSGETGSTIARTQTVNMLREMMFRTCERYLSGAISAAEFQTVAARDQRIMVSILAIEQLTGSINPPAVTISSTGNASTGFDPASMAAALGRQQSEVNDAQANLSTAQSAWTSADAPGGTCSPLFAQAEAGTPWTGNQQSQFTACGSARDGLQQAQSALSGAQANLAAMQSAARGLGTSTASTDSNAQLAANTARTQAVTQVAKSVEKIVALTFDQDETLLFCLQVLDRDDAAGGALDPIANNCLRYLNTKVEADRQQLAARYGIPADAVNSAVSGGTSVAMRRQTVAAPLQACAANPAMAASITQALTGTGINATAFIANAASDPVGTLSDLGSVNEGIAISKLNSVCNLGATQ